jgi:hypothetical protein
MLEDLDHLPAVADQLVVFRLLAQFAAEEVDLVSESPLLEGTCLERTGAAVIRRNARYAIAARRDERAP